MTYVANSVPGTEHNKERAEQENGVKVTVTNIPI